MKTNGEIERILATRVVNEDDDRTRVVHKILTVLGVPEDPPARWPLLPIRNPAGTAPWRPDFVLVAEPDVPMVVIEAKPRAGQYAQAVSEAQVYARNFDPVGPGVRRMTPPFLIAAAGSQFRMFRGRTRGLDVLYEEIRQEEKLAFLEWSDIVAEATSLARPDAPVRPVHGVRALAQQFFEAAHGAPYRARALRGKDDERIAHLCALIDAARAGGSREGERYALSRRLGASVARRVRGSLEPYDTSVSSGLLSGSDAALAFRDFITSDSKRKGLKLFTGASQSRPVLRRGRTVYRETGRYFTPADVIRQMVRLASVRSTDWIIDFCCGSGGFLGQVLHDIGQSDPAALEKFATEQLVGIDDDPFCVTATRTYLSLYLPELRERWRVYLHNALYDTAPENGELGEHSEAVPFLQPDLYDVVLSNPPGNKEYSGTNRVFVEALWEKRYGALGDAWDHIFFVRRAIELARPDGGRICILVPDGFLSNEKFQALRDEVFRDCALHAVISLPRVFRNNDARMAILYAVRGEHPGRNRVFLAEARERVEEPAGEERECVWFVDLEAIVDRIVDRPTSVSGSGA